MADVKKRGWGEDSIYFDHRAACRDSERHRGCPGRWRGTMSLGSGPDGKRRRRKVSGRSRAEVKEKLQPLHAEMREGVRSSASYTVKDAVDDWIAQGLAGLSAKTISTNREVLAPLTALIGAVKLRELPAAHVRAALGKLAATRSTRTVQIAHNGLARAIRYAEADDLVGRNVAALVTAPKGQEGRPSRSLTLAQARALIEASESSRLHAYIVLCVLTGCRTEEARALRWDHVELEGDPDGAAALWRCGGRCARTGT